MASSPICVLFISCLSALARSSSTALNRSGENSCPSVGAFLGEMVVFTRSARFSCRVWGDALYQVEEFSF